MFGNRAHSKVVLRSIRIAEAGVRLPVSPQLQKYRDKVAIFLSVDSKKCPAALLSGSRKTFRYRVIEIEKYLPM